MSEELRQRIAELKAQIEDGLISLDGFIEQIAELKAENKMLIVSNNGIASVLQEVQGECAERGREVVGLRAELARSCNNYKCRRYSKPVDLPPEEGSETEEK